jgi:predicted nuclease of predicted toxin-antitoxin system
VRVLLDANLSPGRVGHPLRERGHNVRALAAEPDLEGLDDEPVLELATQDERILVTRNSRDFAPITRRWSEAGRQHAGVILIWSLTHRQFNEIVHGVEHWLGQYPNPQDWRGLVVGI